VFVGISTTAGSTNNDNTSVRLLAFDAANGTLLWSFAPDVQTFPYQDASVWFVQRPYALGDLAFMTLNTGDERRPTLLAIDVQTGQLRWTLDHTFERDQGGIPDVTLAGGKLVALQWSGSGEEFTYHARVLDPQTGKVLQDLVSWDTDDLGTFDSFHDPFLQSHGDTVFILTTTGLYAYDVNTGERKFNLDLNNARYAVSGDLVFVQRSFEVTAYDANTGEQRWTYKADQLRRMGAYFSWIVADHGTVRVICNCPEQDADDGTAVYVFDAETGALRFSQVTSESYSFTYFLRAPATDEVVLLSVGRYRKYQEVSGIVAVDAQTGDPRWQFVTAPTRLKMPATDGRQVFVTGFDSRLRAFLTPLDTKWRFSVGADES
jgi:outer membrane protein assembly factor BamB